MGGMSSRSVDMLKQLLGFSGFSMLTLSAIAKAWRPAGGQALTFPDNCCNEDNYSLN
jgi:hypothetical protein